MQSQHPSIATQQQVRFLQRVSPQIKVQKKIQMLEAPQTPKMVRMAKEAATLSLLTLKFLLNIFPKEMNLSKLGLSAYI